MSRISPSLSTARHNIDQWTLFKAVLPFLATETAVVGLMIPFPGIPNWLPNLLG